MARQQVVYTEVGRKSTKQRTQWEASTGEGPIAVMVHSNAELAGGARRGWLRGWRCPGQLAIKQWLASLGQVHFLWALSLGGKTV